VTRYYPAPDRAKPFSLKDQEDSLATPPKTFNLVAGYAEMVSEIN
jgi:hypothetical protein